MNLLILIKNNGLDQSIVNFTTSLFKIDGVAIYLLNIVPINGEVPTQMNGRVLPVCTEFDLSEHIKQTELNWNYLNTIEHKTIAKRDAFAGNKIRIIQDYIIQNKIDLIIGGAHKTTAMEDVFVKTFASKAIENTNIPYFTIKCNRDNFTPKKIALIGDFINAETEDLESLKKIAEMHNSQITLTKIWTDSDKRSKEAIEKVMNSYAIQNNLNVTNQIVKSRDKESGLALLEKDHETDLIVMPRSHKKTFFKLLGHTEQTDIINHIYAPILIY
ncbi:MAG: hypothetical protein ACI8ZM_004629 [Crocinitomix sp.]|jgi:hypothetical protein